MAAFLEELRRSRAEAKTAHLRSDATARSAAERVEAARRQLREAGVVSVETGSFGAMMDVALVNYGPVTIVLER